MIQIYKMCQEKTFLIFHVFRQGEIPPATLLPWIRFCMTVIFPQQMEIYHRKLLLFPKFRCGLWLVYKPSEQERSELSDGRFH